MEIYIVDELDFLFIRGLAKIICIMNAYELQAIYIHNNSIENLFIV